MVRTMAILSQEGTHTQRQIRNPRRNTGRERGGGRRRRTRRRLASRGRRRTHPDRRDRAAAGCEWTAARFQGGLNCRRDGGIVAVVGGGDGGETCDGRGMAGMGQRGRVTGNGLSEVAVHCLPVISARPTYELYKSFWPASRSALSLLPTRQRPRHRASRDSPTSRPPRPTSAMISTPRPPSIHSNNAEGDPFSAFLRPPTSETEHERVARLQREADAKRISDSIDEEIKADRERMRKSKQDIRVSCPSHAVAPLP